MLYDARTRETYQALFREAESVLRAKLAADLAPVLAAHPEAFALLQQEGK